MITNLLPYRILQPWVDAAFKKRGIDPEEFWRSAGLPAFRLPDPNGTRFPNGAPPPAPPVLEGTPIIRGRPWRRDRRARTPRHRQRCRGRATRCRVRVSIKTEAPSGRCRAGFPAPVDVLTSPPNPNGLPPTPGIPIAGRPGIPPPDVPGTPVPLPPNAPPGARTEPSGPAGPTPPPSTFAPGLPPGPPAPPGPGPQLRPASRPEVVASEHRLQYP